MASNQQLSGSHQARRVLVKQRLEDPRVVLGFRRECALMDVVINHDMGLADDLVLAPHGIPEAAPRWASFLVGNRSVEQAFKIIAPIAEPKDIGHNLKSRWADVIDRSPQAREQDVLGSLRSGYLLWQGLFQSPWRDLDALLAHVESNRNAMEYVLIAPEQRGAQIDPLLPMALADVAAMSWGTAWTMSRSGFDPARLGVRLRDTTVGKLRDIIGSYFTDHSGVNLNIELVNEKCREHGYLRLWSRVFHALEPCKVTRRPAVQRTMKFRDGTQHEEIVDYEGAPRYAYTAPDASDALVEYLGEEELARAHVDVAEALANTRDWRLQFFIKMSECAPIDRVDGVLTDSTSGAWRRGVFQRPPGGGNPSQP